MDVLTTLLLLASLAGVGTPPGLAASAGTNPSGSQTASGGPQSTAGGHVGQGRDSRARWSWPFSPRPAVGRFFDPPAVRWARGHRGVDLLPAVGPAVVLAPAAGRVVFAGDVAGRAVLTIEHAGGLRSTFEPVNALVPVGTVVRAGTQIGRLAPGPSHCAPAACLHWGVRRGDLYLDPLSFIASSPPVLLPLDAAPRQVSAAARGMARPGSPGARASAGA